MNPLTLVKRIQNINSKEAALGVSEQASWHASYKESAYVYVGGISFDMTEGDLLAVFAQYGEIVDVNLVRDKGTGKSRGFAFIAYEDQRSTNLAVDNLNGAQIVGRTIRVDHVSNYKKKEEEDEELEKQKREERGVCRAFQRGECTRGAGCKFSHDEQRAANTGWGAEDHKRTRWGHDKFEGLARSEKKSDQLSRAPDSAGRDGLRLTDKEERGSRVQENKRGIDSHHKRNESTSRYQENRGSEKQLEQKGSEMNSKYALDRQKFDERSTRHGIESDSREDGDKREDKRSRMHERDQDYRGIEKQLERKESKDEGDRQAFEQRSTRRGFESDSREDRDRREDKRSRKHEPVSYHREDRENRGKDKQPVHGRDSSSHRYRGNDEDHL